MTRARGPKAGDAGHRIPERPQGPRAQLTHLAELAKSAAPEVARALLDAAAVSSPELRVLSQVVRALSREPVTLLERQTPIARPVTQAPIEVLCGVCGREWTAGHDCKRRKRP